MLWPIQHDWTCYASQDDSLNVPCADKKAEDCADASHDHPYHDVSSNFAASLYWGLANNFFMILFFYAFRWHNSRDYTARFHNCTENVLIAGIFTTFLSWLAHFIMVLIMRYRHAGKVCSGDYLAEQNETWQNTWDLAGT